MAKTSKQTKKFISSGNLKSAIDKRRKHQSIQRKTAGREATKLRKQRKGKGTHEDEEGSEEDEDLEDVEVIKSRGKGKGKGKERAEEDEEEGQMNADEDISEGESLDLSDLENDFADLSDDDENPTGEAGDDDDEAAIAADEEAMAKSLAELSKKDPEFFKYLEENERELLEFGQEGDDSEDEEDEEVRPKAKKAEKAKAKGKKAVKTAEQEVDEDASMDYDAASTDDEAEPDFGDEEKEEKKEKIAVTMKMLRGWQRAMIEQQSLRSLKKLILAFRAAAHMNEEDEEEVQTRYKIQSAQVFNKLILTALKYTPMVLNKHMPVKELASGRYKTPTSPKSHPTLPRLILSHFTTILYLIKSLPSAPTPNSADGEDDEAGVARGLLYTVVVESAKLLPWVMEGRRQVKAYLKILLDLWSSGADDVRIACFLAVRKVYIAGDETVKELCLKNIYSALLPPLRLTSAHTLPSLNLMKNSAADLYQLTPSLSYQYAFNYIRALAIHLRKVVRAGAEADQDAFRAVYNWQFVHSIDFWSLVLSGACDKNKVMDNGGLASPLEPLIFPLVQIALGVIRLVPTSRFFPLRFHVVQSLLRITSRTGTYIPLAPFLLEILDSSEFRKSNPKAVSLKPLDLEYIIRAPAAYQKTRIYQEVLADELVFVMGEYFAVLSTNIAFPEMTIPVLTTLRRYLKKGGASGKSKGPLKTLVEKIEATRIWLEKKRANVTFAPNERAEVDAFLENAKVEETPIGSWMRLQKKVRDQRRKEIEAAQREERERKSRPAGGDSDVDMD